MLILKRRGIVFKKMFFLIIAVFYMITLGGCISDQRESMQKVISNTEDDIDLDISNTEEDIIWNISNPDVLTNGNIYIAVYSS